MNGPSTLPGQVNEILPRALGFLMTQIASLDIAMRWESDAQSVDTAGLDRIRALDRFLLDVERRAYRIARIAVRHDEDALDIVQDAMLQLARRYGQRATEEWRPLFFRILQNRIRDCLRRRKVRMKFLAWLPGRTEDLEAADAYDGVPDAAPLPSQVVVTGEAMRALEAALTELPARQQEAFMLRNFEGLDVAETARAMSCSEGSVKTHYSRAVHTLRDRLADSWGDSG